MFGDDTLRRLDSGCMMSGSLVWVSEPEGMLVFRLFFSHSTADLDYVNQLADALERQELPCFVAPRDIPRATEWLPRIERELQQCDALIALLTPTFQASEWADQEVGYALGTDKLVIPLRRFASDPPPYGFLRKVQAIDADDDVLRVADAVFDSLLEHEREREKLVDIIIERMRLERNQTRLRQWTSRLRKVEHHIDTGRRARLIDVLTHNAALRLDGRARTTVLAITDAAVQQGG